MSTKIIVIKSGITTATVRLLFELFSAASVGVDEALVLGVVAVAIIVSENETKLLEVDSTTVVEAGTGSPGIVDEVRLSERVDVESAEAVDDMLLPEIVDVA